MRKSEESLHDLWDTIRVPEGEERTKETESIFKEIMSENVPNLGLFQEAHRLFRANKS